ncbi:AraC family transcriptional regulator [Haliea sp. E17]|uniref:AraC family transcriptional regulator n=1 Tax=Haliea sp. E17 TaxID=3401576 RepID=UPI003AABFFDB
MNAPLALRHSVLGTSVLPVAQALRLYGLEPLEVMSHVGLDAAKLADPDWRIPNTRFAALMDYSVEITGDEAFGLVAAEQLRPQVLRGLGLAWLASDTVYAGLQRLVRFGKLVSTSAHIRMREEADLVHIEFGKPLLGDSKGYVNRDYMVGSVVRMCNLVLGEFIAPAGVCLDRPEPENPQRWESMLCSRVAFGCDTCTLSWYRPDIIEPLVTGNPALARANDEISEAYLKNFLGRSTARDVADKILELLPDGPPSQQQVADELHVSNRTLQRKLKEEGTSFSDLLQDTRLQLARKYLNQGSRSVVETAYLLGFSEPSTFSRAFKRWTGLAPAEFREAARAAE